MASEQHDIVIVAGPEPNMRWRAYTDAICGLAGDMGVGLVVTLGAHFAQVSHQAFAPQCLMEEVERTDVHAIGGNLAGAAEAHKPG
jgi:uncharacterized protein (DUF111 family)